MPGIPRGERSREGAQRRGDFIDMPAESVKEKKIDSDPGVEYEKILDRILLKFGNKILEEHAQSPIPGNLEGMLKNYSSEQLINEIKDTEKENWKISGVMFKAIVDELRLRLWEVRNKRRRSGVKSADILKI